MNGTLQEQQSGAAFSRQAPVFDEIDRANGILLWMRDRVHAEVLRHAKPGDRMLELNCGTGIDARFFAEHGLRVLATDNAPGMLAQCEAKIAAAGLGDRVAVRQCSFDRLENLRDEPHFDYIFSNFGGLNCAADLGKILVDIDRLLLPGGYFTLVIMPKICPWELALVLRGKARTAFRRLHRGGVQAKVEGLPFQCYYYDPGFIQNQLKDYFRTISLQTLGLLVPPPYMEGFPERFPKAFRFLGRAEQRIAGRWPFNRMGDHYIITMQKPDQSGAQRYS
jgi:ubiquinone/menaquinone biosynthesis C-methylase UbiE